MGENTEESVGTLDGEAAVERVIDGDQVKLYRARQVVAYLDGPIYDFAAASLGFNASPLPVFDGDMKRIGFASTTVVRDERGHRSLVADISIEYATEERLLAETQSVKLYPRFFGTMKFGAIPLFDFYQRLTPTYLRIDGIQITRLRPVDERIVALGELSL